MRHGRMTHPWCVLLDLKLVTGERELVLGANDLVLLDEGNLWHHADSIDCLLGEVSRVALEVAVVDMTETGSEFVTKEGVLVVGHLEEVHVIANEVGVDVVLEDNHVGVVDGAMGVVVGYEGRDREDGALLEDGMGARRERGGEREGREGEGDDNDDGAGGHGGDSEREVGQRLRGS